MNSPEIEELPFSTCEHLQNGYIQNKTNETKRNETKKSEMAVWLAGAIVCKKIKRGKNTVGCATASKELITLFLLSLFCIDICRKIINKPFMLHHF